MRWEEKQISILLSFAFSPRTVAFPDKRCVHSQIISNFLKKCCVPLTNFAFSRKTIAFLHKLCVRFEKCKRFLTVFWFKEIKSTEMLQVTLPPHIISITNVLPANGKFFRDSQKVCESIAIMFPLIKM